MIDANSKMSDDAIITYVGDYQYRGKLKSSQPTFYHTYARSYVRD